MARRFEGMTEQDRDELLSAYLDGELNEAEQARLEQQLAVDPALQSELDALRRTVEMVRDLPVQPIPRNFILPQSVETRLRPTPTAHPRRRWAAPLLTAATSLVSLLFAIVLAGDLLFTSGAMQMASMPAADEKLSAPQPVIEGVEVEKEAEKEESAEFAASPLPEAANDTDETLPPPVAAAEVEPTFEPSGTPLPSPTPTGAWKESPSDEEEGADAEDQVRAPGTEPSAGAIGGGGEAEKTDTPAPTPLPVVSTPSPPPPAVPSPVAPTVAPAAASTEELTRSAEAGESPAEPIEQPPEARGEDEGEIPIAGPRWTLPVRMLTIALGLTALGLAVITILAWRARRR
jgi:hypothetical protein